ncbi:MAG: hypothetical protein P4L65_02875 [Legionella sp.]|nr:hypothetical protein [Legionella sp.]
MSRKPNISVNQLPPLSGHSESVRRLNECPQQSLPARPNALALLLEQPAARRPHSLPTLSRPMTAHPNAANRPEVASSSIEVSRPATAAARYKSPDAPLLMPTTEPSLPPSDLNLGSSVCTPSSSLSSRSLFSRPPVIEGTPTPSSFFLK